MSYAAHRKDFGSLSVSEQVREEPHANARQPSILRRVFDAILAMRQRDADRQIAHFLATRSPGFLTDELEREISQRFLTSNWGVNADAFSARRFP